MYIRNLSYPHLVPVFSTTQYKNCGKKQFKRRVLNISDVQIKKKAIDSVKKTIDTQSLKIRVMCKVFKIYVYLLYFF